MSSVWLTAVSECVEFSIVSKVGVGQMFVRSVLNGDEVSD